eukprot:scaffold29950_cov60-Phaeocystis_antarctica.AAC.2
MGPSYKYLSSSAWPIASKRPGTSTPLHRAPHSSTHTLRTPSFAKPTSVRVGSSCTTMGLPDRQYARNAARYPSGGSVGSLCAAHHSVAACSPAVRWKRSRQTSSSAATA